MPISVTKIPNKDAKQAIPSENLKHDFEFDFFPNVCQECLTQNELEKFLFENKKIFIRTLDEEDGLVSQNHASTSSQTSSVSQISSMSNLTQSQATESEKLVSNDLKAKTSADNDDDCEIIHHLVINDKIIFSIFISKPKI